MVLYIPIIKDVVLPNSTKVAHYHMKSLKEPKPTKIFELHDEFVISGLSEFCL
jgi:hypothetical protein